MSIRRQKAHRELVEALTAAYSLGGWDALNRAFNELLVSAPKRYHKNPRKFWALVDEVIRATGQRSVVARSVR